MKTLKEIQEIIDKYEELETLVLLKAQILKKNDSKYEGWLFIDDIEFEKDSVLITVNYDGYDNTNTNTFRIPLTYLSLPNEELKIKILEDREERIKLEIANHRKREEEKIEKQNQEELALYEKLKTKFNK